MLKEWLSLLACPRDQLPLELGKDSLICEGGHHYPLVNGIPVMLVEEVEPTHHYCCQTLELVRSKSTDFPKQVIHSGIDPFVQKEIVGTCGHMYRPLQGRLTRYPIPEDLPLEGGGGKTFLDIGANWGRWAIAAAKKGYKAAGLDPSLEAVMALQRVSHQCGYPVFPIVGEARFLPFRKGAVDVAFSYSVFQHFDKQVARQAIAEASRVCRTKGIVLVQMPNKYGIRQSINLIKQKLVRDSNPFRVRYWSPSELRKTFEQLVGPAEIFVDGFFSLNPRPSDVDLLPWHYATLVRFSTFLRGLSAKMRWLRFIADSLWIKSLNLK
ncbi:MAG: methyltransferase domain-containing protein [Candidatus Methanomethylicaceae archaeon]